MLKTPLPLGSAFNHSFSFKALIKIYPPFDIVADISPFIGVVNGDYRCLLSFGACGDLRSSRR